MFHKFKAAIAACLPAKLCVSVGAGMLTLCISHSVSGVQLAQEPLFLATAARPVVMFAMSRDHELFIKAYNDYTNLDGGMATMRDTTYRNDFSYYGYFDSDWCYTYRNNRFEPEVAANNHQCSGSGADGRWSGNFLNWSTMTRMDILRQVLYGGNRSTDTAAITATVDRSAAPAATVLERVYLPRDNHAFAKVYNPNSPENHSGSVSLYTPYSYEAITLCNVSSGSGASGVPQIRVAEGAWYNWANSESVQCQWRNSTTDTFPERPHVVSASRIELTARVKVCDPEKDAEDSSRCLSYEEGSYKPVGLLQRNYQDIDFGLVTGTWAANRSGGVLRKEAGPMAGISYIGNTDNVNEFSRETGVFNPNVVGIIGNINRFRIVGYNYTSGTYNGTTVDWGNPIGEIYAETLRYLSGRRPAGSEEFHGGGPTWHFLPNAHGTDSHLSGITHLAEWEDPLSDAEECTNCSIIVISSGPNSWDSIGGSDSHGITDGIVQNIFGLDASINSLNAATDAIGAFEFGENQTYFNGGTSIASRCTAVRLAGLSAVQGLCPEEPMTQGSYVISGLAYMANRNSIRAESNRTVNTYAVELSQGLPSFNIGVGGGEISIVPVCENVSGNVCSLVSVRVENIQVVNDDIVSGSYLFYWEDKDQQESRAGDYDMDAVQRIEFCVGSYCNNLVRVAGATETPNPYRGSDKNYTNHRAKFTNYVSSGVSVDELLIINTTPYYNAGDRLSMTYSLSGSATDGIQEDERVTYQGFGANHYNTIPPSGSNNLPADTDANHFLSVNSYTVGVTQANLLRSPLFYAAKYGNAPRFSSGGEPLDWDVKNNISGDDEPDGIPDGYFSVNNPALLEQNLTAVLNEIVARNMSGAAATTNSTSLDNGAVIYQALFNSPGWDGELRAWDVNENGTLGGLKWSTRSVTTFPSSPAMRNIVTHNGSGGVYLTEANWGSLSLAQRTALGTEAEGRSIIRWLRGDNVAGLRQRPALIDGNPGAGGNILGDIVNSSPAFAGKSSQRFNMLPDALGGNSYQAFVDAKQSRADAIYVGSNNGMLHAFNADTGQEIFAYVPSGVYENLKMISHPDYGISIQHRYLVDGPVYVSDAYINGGWRTLLVGTQGAGGRSVFVLDVTNPENFGPANVLFELTPSDYPDLGYVLGQPYIVPVGGRWKLVFGNGYNSDYTNAALFVIDLEYPKNLNYSQVIYTSNATSNGLAEPALLPNAQGVVEAAYAGDLHGNMWKFDLAGAIQGNWGVEFGGAPLFSAVYDSGSGDVVSQPITVAPTLGRKDATAGGDAGIVVYFGTGKYLERSDLEPLTYVESVYAIADTGSPVIVNSLRSDVLHEKAISSQSAGIRMLSGQEERMNWGDYEGWFIDLQNPNINRPEGERVINKGRLLYDRLLISTLIPEEDACSFGGRGWLMEFVGVGDKYPASFSILNDGVGGQETDNFLTGVTVIGGDGEVVIVESDIAGGLELNTSGIPTDGVDRGRTSWRQVR